MPLGILRVDDKQELACAEQGMLQREEQQLLAYLLGSPERIIPGSEQRSQLWDLHRDPVSTVVAAHVLASAIESVMGGILYGAGFAMARLLLQKQDTALHRELQTVATWPRSARMSWRTSAKRRRQHRYFWTLRSTTLTPRFWGWNRS